MRMAESTRMFARDNMTQLWCSLTPRFFFTIHMMRTCSTTDLQVSQYTNVKETSLGKDAAVVVTEKIVHY